MLFHLALWIHCITGWLLWLNDRSVLTKLEYYEEYLLFWSVRWCLILSFIYYSRTAINNILWHQLTRIVRSPSSISNENKGECPVVLNSGRYKSVKLKFRIFLAPSDAFVIFVEDVNKSHSPNSIEINWRNWFATWLAESWGAFKQAS